MIIPDRDEMEDEDAYAAWSGMQSCCEVCWKDHREAVLVDIVGLQTHHLVKRSRRLCHLPWNLLRLCERCHRLAEGDAVPAGGGSYFPVLTFAICLGVKRDANPTEWEPDLLEWLYGSPLPTIEPLPEIFTRERERREPVQSWRLLNKPGGVERPNPNRRAKPNR